MTRRRTALAALALTGLMLTGCAAGAPSSGGSSDEKTLTIFTSQTELDFDTAKSQGLAITTNGFFARRLTAWNISPDQPAEVVPDLATDTGTPSEDGRTWTFTLKEGLLFEDGSPITSESVKYGIERSFSSTLQGGLSYHKTLLEGAENYGGPFDGENLASIETPDERTIIFHLNAPYGDWPWIASTPAFAPVPLGEGTDASYGRDPIASGPYKIESNGQGTEAVLTRNENWDPESDTVRTAGPDRIVYKMGQDATVATQAIIANAGEAANAFGAQFVPPSQLAQAQADPNAKDRLVTSGDGAAQFLVINTERVTDLKVRQAIQYATDKNAYRVAAGGEIAGGFATALITPGIPGREEYEPYPAEPSGDVSKAQELLAEAAAPVTPLTLLVSDTQSAQAEAIQAGLARAGITVQIQTLDATSLTAATTDNTGDFDLTLASWQPDFPSASANIEPLFASSQIGNGNYNTSRYSNPEVDALIRQATESTDPEAAQQLWAQADKRIMQDAPVVPLIYSHNTFIHGANVENFFIGAFPAYPNYLAVTVK